MNITIKVNLEEFTATLANTPAAETFLNLLPMTVKMKELHRNEKYYELPQKLPMATYKPGTINSGDIMLFRSDIFVIFYETFQTSYEYTPIGRIPDTTRLENALGDGNVEVTFEALINQ